MESRKKPYKRNFTKWREALRRSLKNITTLNKILKVYYLYQNGEIRMRCPDTKKAYSVLDVAEGTFYCECGYKDKGDIFSLIMHLKKISFAKALAEISDCIQFMTPRQSKRQRAQRLRRKKLKESYFGISR